MPRKKKSRKQLKRKRQVEVVCRANGCTKVLLISEKETNKVTLCQKCNHRIEQLCDNEGMHWFTAHLDESYIMACSRPEILPPSTLPLERIEPEYSPVEAILKARKFIENATSILILAGAGASVDSGLPDFRGAEGYYRYKNKEIPMETINFHSDRGGDLAISWGFILRMMQMFSTKTPHAGYQLLHKLCKEKNEKKKGSAFVFTSNIDGYFERAGFDADYLYECHGSTSFLQCIDLCKKRPEVFHIDDFNNNNNNSPSNKSKKRKDKNNNNNNNNNIGSKNNNGKKNKMNREKRWNNNTSKVNHCWWKSVKFNEESLRVLNMDVIPSKYLFDFRK
jgi:NAD-dependent SIR2 family protein deacetylase